MTDRISAEEEIARLKAARALGGYASPQALADAIGEKGMSGGTLRTVESRTNPRRLEPSERAAIARVCGVPEGFFTVPREQLGGNQDASDADARLAELQASIDEIRAALLTANLLPGDAAGAAKQAALEGAERARRSRQPQQPPSREGRRGGKR